MTKIVALIENTRISKEYYAKHGLCLYIETGKHKILFDLGSDNKFAKNAEKMGIDIQAVDTVVISHGHKDHGGALKTFLKLNDRAKIYIRKTAFAPHFIKLLHIPFSVSLDKGLVESDRFVFTGDRHVIDQELTLFSNVKASDYYSKANDVLLARKDGRFVRDDFCHEQNLIITAPGRKILISGCSHTGIVNIQREARTVAAEEMAYVIGGFHLFNPTTGKQEAYKLIDEIASALKEKKSTYYTCHCTGVKTYERMKQTLGDRLQYLSTGMELNL